AGVAGVLGGGGGGARGKGGNGGMDAVSTSSITLRWKDRARGESRYEVRTDDEAKAAGVRRNKTKFTDKGLEPGTVHGYRVRACKGHRCSGFSPLRRQATLLAPFNGPHPDPECRVFPSSHAWNEDVTAPPPTRRERPPRPCAAGGNPLPPSSGSTPDSGHPSAVAPGDRPGVGTKSDQSGDRSAPGRSPIPPHAPIESGSDHHVVVVQRPI